MIHDVSKHDKHLIDHHLKEAMSACCQDLTNRHLTKAHALNPSYTFYKLAVYYLGLQQTGKALDYFREAFEMGLRDKLFLHQAADCLLRHGTCEQYTSFFQQIVAEDPGNDDASFVLATINFYHVTVAALHAQLNRDLGSKKPKIILNATFWGAKYADIFLHYSLAALMSGKNIPALSEQYEIHFVLATTAADFRQLHHNPLFRKLLSHVQVHFLELPENLLEVSISFAKEDDGNWSIPVTMLTNSQQYAVIECARLLGLDLVMIYPDHILTNSFLSDLLPQNHDYSAIAGLCFRFHYDASLLEAIASHRRDDGILDIDSQMLVNWLLQYLPEENYVDAKSFSAFPIYVCWRVGSEGLIAHVNHYCLWFIRGRDLTGPIYPTLDPIDGFFLDRRVPDKGKIGLAPEQVIGFDLGTNPLVAPLDGTGFHPAKVACWLKPFLTDVHRKYFEKPMKYSATGNYDSPEWDEVGRAAGAAVQEIISQAKGSAGGAA